MGNISSGVQGSVESAPDSARVERTEANGWRKPKHGAGMLKPWRKGETGRPPGVLATRYTETQALARSHSLEAVQTLVERLRDPDGRIAVVAANSILERAWGKVREAKPEEHKAASIDLTALSGAELALLLKLADSGRLREAEESQSPTVIDGTAEREG